MRQAAQAILDALDSPEAELSVLIVDDEQIAALNREYLQRSGPTNVIAFPMRSGEFPRISPHLLGDVVISIQTAAREARGAQMHTSERLLQLLVHGILHLFGYDHEAGGRQAAEMDSKSRELVARVRPDRTMLT